MSNLLKGYRRTVIAGMAERLRKAIAWMELAGWNVEKISTDRYKVSQENRPTVNWRGDQLITYCMQCGWDGETEVVQAADAEASAEANAEGNRIRERIAKL